MDCLQKLFLPYHWPNWEDVYKRQVFNGEKYIKNCIEMLLNQGETYYEIVVINDGSTDNTAQIMQAYQSNRKVLYLSLIHIYMKKLTVKGCVAMIPEARQKKRRNGKKAQLLITNKHVDWGFKQAVLAAQNRIERQMEKENKHVLLVSSTIPEEGKSLMALNIALGFSIDVYKRQVFMRTSVRQSSSCLPPIWQRFWQSSFLL